MAAGAVRWSCARCRVAVGRLDGKRVALPPTWTRSGKEIFCLSCSRALAAEAAVESAPADCSRHDLVRIRRTALIRFEISRVPDAPNRRIAQACRTSTGAVAAIRAEPSPPARTFEARSRSIG